MVSSIDLILDCSVIFKEEIMFRGQASLDLWSLLRSKDAQVVHRS